MSGVTVHDLSDDFPFGARVEGANYETVSDPAVRAELKDVFEKRGIIVFQGIEPSSKMQVAISNVFGPLRDHYSKTSARVDAGGLLGVIDIHFKPRLDDGDNRGLVEIGGKLIAGFVPWHFDACYVDALNRGGALRAVVIPPEGGRTGFIDGVAAYKQLPDELRERIEGLNIIYVNDTRMSKMRFGRMHKFFGERPEQLARLKEAQSYPRAIHPAVWTRKNGEKVLHVGLQMAVGIEHHEDPEGDDLLEQLAQWINHHPQIYWHSWKADDVIVWDNWRMLHAVEGMDKKYERRTQRTTIEGDYGLGHFEHGKKIGEVFRELQM